MPSHESAADAPQHVPSEVRPPSISRLLAACAAATAVSTPPDAEDRRRAGAARPGTHAAPENTPAGTTAADVLAATAPGRDRGTPPDARPRSDVA